MSDAEDPTIDAEFCYELFLVRLPFFFRRKKVNFYGIGAAFLIFFFLTSLSPTNDLDRATKSVTPSKPIESRNNIAKVDSANQASSVSSLKGSSSSISLTPTIENNYADTWSSKPLSNGPDTPIFWNVPKAGGNAIKFILSKCYGYILASESGAGHETENLEVISIGGASFVNVNVVSILGIERAKTLNLGSSGIVDVIFTPHINEMADVFSPTNKGRIFTILRHPVDRAVSIFYHEQAVNPSFAGMSITEYFGRGGGVVENNWMTRFLTNKKGGTLTPDDLNLAMEILRRKVLIGLVDEMEESLRRFKTYMGWVEDKNRGESDTSACERQQFLTPTVQSLPEVTRGSEPWNLIMTQNRFDMQVYEYALNLFGEQKGMLTSMT